MSFNAVFLAVRLPVVTVFVSDMVTIIVVNVMVMTVNLTGRQTVIRLPPDAQITYTLLYHTS